MCWKLDPTLKTRGTGNEAPTVLAPTIGIDAEDPIADERCRNSGRPQTGFDETDNRFGLSQFAPPEMARRFSTAADHPKQWMADCCSAPVLLQTSPAPAVVSGQ